MPMATRLAQGLFVVSVVLLVGATVEFVQGHRRLAVQLGAFALLWIGVALVLRRSASSHVGSPGHPPEES